MRFRLIETYKGLNGQPTTRETDESYSSLPVAITAAEGLAKASNQIVLVQDTRQLENENGGIVRRCGMESQEDFQRRAEEALYA